MKIEYLFREYTCLYGDQANVTYLEQCLKVKAIYTSFNDTPAFVNNNIDIIYMGSVSENNQEKIIEKLMPYKERIKELVDKGVIFLCTGNSFEIFGKYILKEDGTKINCLELFDYYSKRTIPTRYNSLYLGKFNDIKITSYTSRFSHTYATSNYLFENIKGYGMNLELPYEGVRYNNFFGTYLLGPILILNPYFTKYLLSLLKYKKKLIHEQEMITAYDIRLSELINRDDMNN